MRGNGGGASAKIRRCTCVFAALFLVSAIASAQVVEGNVDVTGSPAAGYDLGQPARQENEPSCAVNPLNSSNILCAYNWYGYADLPTKQGDAWIGFSETTDGRQFIRRPLTGTKLNYPLGKGFAADPTMLVWPGGAAVTSIVGDRDGNTEMVIQRMVELNRESGFRHVSEAGQIVIASIQGSNFIDKPDAEVFIKPGGGTRSVTMTLEEKDKDGKNLVVTRQWPEMTICVAFAVFNGSTQNVRTYSTCSDDFGAAGSWSNPRQISQTSGLDQGLSMANIGDTILYTARRFDSGDGDAIIGAISKDRGYRIGKVFTITDLCAFDQPTLPDASSTLPDPLNRAAARTNDFPWVSATGSQFVLVYAERPRDAQGNCLSDYSQTAGSRIVMRTSSDGTHWTPAVPVTPPNLNEPVHFEFMPNVACARGACNVIFYSTLTESENFENLLGAAADQAWKTDPYIDDFNVDDANLGLLRYRRSVDVFSSKITIASDGTPTPSANPERVSRYQVDYDAAGNPYEIEWNPLNIRNFGGNTVPFDGDYIGLAAPKMRRNPDTGAWESNAAPIGDIADPINRVNYFAAWTDNRRIRGFIYNDAFFENGDQTPLPYEVSSATGVTGTSSTTTTGQEGEEDPNPTPTVCSPSTGPNMAYGEYQTRIKNSEIYGATIEDRVRLVSPTVAKNLLTKSLAAIQRAFVIGVNNVDGSDPRTLRLVVANQPGQTPPAPDNPPTQADVLPTARASWRQLPYGPSFDPNNDPPPVIQQAVTVEPLSTTYVTLFVVSNVDDAPVTVYAYDDVTGAFVSRITVNGTSEAGDLIDPGTTPDNSVLLEEIHDPGLIQPDWSSLQVTPLSPNFKNPNFKNPNFKNPNFKNTDYLNPNLKNPNFINPNFKNTTEEATSLQNPNLKNPNLKNETPTDFVDVTYTVVSQDNTTTAVNADFAYGGTDLDGLDTQVIAWQADDLNTQQGCESGTITQSKVISAKSNPNLKNLAPADINDPFQGFVTFPLPPKGKVEVTLRIFCPDEGTCQDLIATDSNGESKLSKSLGYSFWSQAANTGKDQITPDQEQVTKDVIGPVFNIESGHVFVAEAEPATATQPAGAPVDLVGDGSISADDDGSPANVTCSLLLSTGAQTMPAFAPLGETGATCTTSDAAGNVSTWNGFVLVEDNTPPVINLPGSTLTVAPTSAAGANVDFLGDGNFDGSTITVAEAISPDAVTLTCKPASGSLFPIGDTPVTCTATDAGPCDPANTSCVNGVNVSEPASFTVSVVDSDPPVINGGAPLGDVTVEATAVLTPVTLTAPSFHDTVDPSPTITNDAPAAGFPLGTTVVTWTATDFAGNTSTATQNVTVQDTTAPVVHVPADISVIMQSAAGTPVSFNDPPTADDIFLDSFGCVIDGTSTSVDKTGGTFPVGTTTVRCTATDTSGNSASASFDVTVQFGKTNITTTKSNAKGGTSVPLYWAWTDENGVPQNIGSGNQTIHFAAGPCPQTVEYAEDPGSSSFQQQPDFSWQYNWQTVDPSGADLPAGNYCLTVTLTTTNQQQEGTITLN